MLPHPTAILIDLDDTILDATDSSSRVWRDTAGHFAGEIGRSVDEIEPVMDEVRKWYWSDPQRNAAGRIDLFKARADVARIALEKLGAPSGDLPERYAAFYNARRVEAMQPFPGAIETIHRLRERGYRLGLLSNGKGETQRAKVSRFELEALFEVVVIEGEFGKGKPDPEVYAHAMQTLSATPATTWMVGDNLEWEVGVPQELGMTGVWVDWAKQGLPAGSTVKPNAIVHAIRELPALLGE